MDNKEFFDLVRQASEGDEQAAAYLTYIDNIEFYNPGFPRDMALINRINSGKFDMQLLFRRDMGPSDGKPASKDSQKAQQELQKHQDHIKNMRNNAGKNGIKGRGQ